MDSREIVGKLTINIDDKPIELDILSGSLERSCTSFNFESQENIDGYNLAIDVSECSKDVMRDIDNVSSTLDRMFRVILKLDGEEKEGNAKISQNLAFCGVSLDIELHS